MYNSVFLITFLLYSLVSLNAEDPKVNVKCTSQLCQDEAASIIGSMDLDTDPCEDFYQFACGNFKQLHPIPEGRTLWDNFQILQNYSDSVAKDVLSAPLISDDPIAVRKAKTMYTSCMDTDSLDERGLDPLLNIIRDVGGWPLLIKERNDTDIQFTWNRLASITSEYGVSMMFDIIVRANLFNANTTIIYLERPGLTLPVALNNEELSIEDFLQEEEEVVVDYAYTLYLNKIALHLKDELHTDATDEAIIQDLRDVLSFMRILSATMKSIETQATPANGVITFAILQEWTSNRTGVNPTLEMDWLEYFNTMYAKTDIVLTPDDSIFISDLNKVGSLLDLYSNTSPRIIANFVLSRLLVYLSPETDKYMRDAAKEFYLDQKFITEDYPRWQYCIHKVNDYPRVGLSMAIAYQLQLAIFQSQKLLKAEKMVIDLRAAFQELLLDNLWMDEGTRQMAASKADKMVVLEGLPEWLKDTQQLNDYYDQLDTLYEDHLGNTFRLRSYMQSINLATIAKARNRFEWTQSPLIVNAFYNGLNNRITFPVGIMNSPFFNDNDVGALNYGRIGAVIGHEITHGFDSSGRIYNGEGTLFYWWSNDTDFAFTERESCFIRQYSNYSLPEINQMVNGALTSPENVADNGGLRSSYRAFQRLVDGDFDGSGQTTLPGLELLSADQLFFLAYATMWCRSETPDGLLSMAKDSHSPNRYRVIGTLSNMIQFSEAWSCPNNSPMNPANKCTLW